MFSLWLRGAGIAVLLNGAIGAGLAYGVWAYHLSPYAAIVAMIGACLLELILTGFPVLKLVKIILVLVVYLSIGYVAIVNLEPALALAYIVAGAVVMLLVIR